MPGMDGTGPEGQGPRSGRRRGNCGSEERTPARGTGRGRPARRGRGKGYRRGN